MFKIICFLTTALIVGLTGCAELFDSKPTERTSQNIISDLSKIKILPSKNQQILDIYNAPPEVVKTTQGLKVFYYCKHLTTKVLAKILLTQLKIKVSELPSVNQLIIPCKDQQTVDDTLMLLKNADVSPIQVHIDCVISERFADVTMDWETTIEATRLFGSDKFAVAPVLKDIFDPRGNILRTEKLPAFPGSSLRSASRGDMGLKVGITGENFTALVDMLVSRGYLKILMNPSLDVINGQTAEIKTIDNVPVPKFIDKNNEVYTTTEYKQVIDSLKITPHVYADGYIGLQTHAVIGSRSTPEGVSQIPILTERMINNTENRIRIGESLVIGGIRKSEKGSVVRGVPLLKDIPLIGILFSSKDSEERAKEIIFIITPTISSSSMPNDEMVDMLHRKHAEPDDNSAKEVIQNTILDPLNTFEKIEERREKERQAELELLSAEMATRDAELAQEDAQLQAMKAQEAENASLAALKAAEQARTDSSKAAHEAQVAKENYEKARKDVQSSSKAAIEKANKAKVAAEKLAKQAALDSKAAINTAEKRLHERKAAEVQAKKSVEEAKKANAALKQLRKELNALKAKQPKKKQPEKKQPEKKQPPKKDEQQKK